MGNTILMRGHPKSFHVEHEARVCKHIERYQTLNALLQTYDTVPTENLDIDYIRELKYRVSKAKNQLRVMGIDLFVNGERR